MACAWSVVGQRDPTLLKLREYMIFQVAVEILSAKLSHMDEITVSDTNHEGRILIIEVQPVQDVIMVPLRPCYVIPLCRRRIRKVLIVIAGRLWCKSRWCVFLSVLLQQDLARSIDTLFDTMQLLAMMHSPGDLWDGIHLVCAFPALALCVAMFLFTLCMCVILCGCITQDHSTENNLTICVV